MALDYNQKRPINKNRPRKRPIKVLLLLTLGGFVSLYGLGIATGWLVFKYLPEKSTPTPAASPQANGTEQAPPSSAHSPGKNATAIPEKEPDLTFYYTLPKGEKGVIGSGLNNPPPQTPPKSAPTAAAAVPQQPKSAEKPEASDSAAQKENAGMPSGTTQSAVAGKSSGKTTYTVQVAAYQEKSDALNLLTKLQKNGISSRIEDYAVPGKGIWFRVRTGSKLDKETANKVAAKLGGSALLVKE